MYKLCVLLCVLFCNKPLFAGEEGFSTTLGSEYVILASTHVKNDATWMDVVRALQEKHEAMVFYYEKSPRETLSDLRREHPRYVAIVEKPEYLDRDYVINMHMLSREVNDDIYADFLWGIITGYDAEAALRMVSESVEPLIVKSAFSTITELREAKWFDRYAWIDDHQEGVWGEKDGKKDSVHEGKVTSEEVMDKFMDLYAKYASDLVVTAFHATTGQLKIPFYNGNVVAKNGVLYAGSPFWDDRKSLLPESGKRKVYFAVGNCLIGNVDNSRESMAMAWMKGSHATVMVGYVVETWYGRNGWGGLKYWLTNSGRYSLAEAIYLNQQDMLFQLNEWIPEVEGVKYLFPGMEYGADDRTADGLGIVTRDQRGFWYDRDVVAYYGDPKWDVRLQEVPGENDFTVTSKMKGKKCVITIRTGKNFSLERMKGGHFKEEHVLDLPFSYFFPKRLDNPRLAPGQAWKVALSENFMLVYDVDFQPGDSYQIVLDVD